MSKDSVFLHPDFVGEVVEELLSSDIISKEKVAQLKNDCIKIVDPNVMMDIRHKEVKSESLIGFKNNRSLPSETAKTRGSPRSCLKPFKAMKDLKTIDKEIAKTKKNLIAFQNQLLKKHENFLSHIGYLEEQEREQCLEPPQFVNLGKEEAANYFNLHLDHLEVQEFKNFPKQQTINVWKPFQARPSSVVKVITPLKTIDVKPRSVHLDEEELVITTLKAIDIKPKSVKFNDDEELHIMKMLKMDEIHVKDENLLTLSSEDEPLQEVRNVVPNNTPSLYPNDSSSNVSKLSNVHSNSEIVQEGIKRWKMFVAKKKTKRKEELVKRKEEFGLVKKIFEKWLGLVNQTKEKKEEDKLIYNYLKKSQGSCVKKTSVETSKEKTRKCLEVQKKNLDCCVDFFPSEICTKIIKSEPFSPSKSIRKNTEFKTSKATSKLKVSSKFTDDGKINIKNINPEELGLVNSIAKSEQKKHIQVEKYHEDAIKTVVNEENLPRRMMIKTGNSNICQEPLSNRFAAQEKIIAQQLEVIEDQKKMIFDLQARNLQVQSKLSLQVAESELAKASCNKKLKPIHKAPDTSRQISNSMAKLEEKSEKLCKSMLERQEYCKQLAERTKFRKMRIEEEKAKLKLEQEEREIQEKEEERRQRVMKIKLEQQLAKEKAQKNLALKWQISELTTIAINHHNKNLLSRTFKAFKQVSLDTYLKSNECNKMYERNLLKRAFVFWRSDVKQSIASKFEMAEKYYCVRIMERYWTNWRREHQEYKIKVQVSEDMYALKLQERMLRRWTVFAAKQYLQNCCRMELAERLHRKQTLRHVFRHWRELPRLMFAEREREQRRRAWRHAVQELVPDFSPFFADQLDT